MSPRRHDHQNIEGGHRAALVYLQASGARAISISIIDVDGVAEVHAGAKPAGNAVAVLWTPRAKGIAWHARQIAGERPSAEQLVEAVHQAATQCRVTLTDHATAITRASAAAAKLDDVMEEMRRSGQLVAFNNVYKARRQASKSIGRGFMSFPQAMGRLKQALIPVLAQGGDPHAAAPGLFAAIFR
jgi:hypothetical protein